MARTTSQLVSALAAGTTGPSPPRARRPPGPDGARRPRIPRAGRRLTWGRAPGRRRAAGAAGTHQPPRGAGVREVGAGADRGAEGGEAGEVSPAGRGASVWKVCFRRGLEPSLRGYFSFCARRGRQGPSPQRGPGALPQQKQEVGARYSEHLVMLRAFRIPGEHGGRGSFPGPEAAFPDLCPRSCGAGSGAGESPWEARLNPTDQGNGSMAGRRAFVGKEKAFDRLNVLLKVYLAFLCFLYVAKSISIFLCLFFLLLGRRFRVLYLVCECGVSEGRMSRQLAKFG